jgi:hypothetical protein
MMTTVHLHLVLIAWPGNVLFRKSAGVDGGRAEEVTSDDDYQFASTS